ncbi:MAG: response regulator [Thermodesulfobacteriota bacterium]
MIRENASARILVVDDEIHIQHMLRTCLTIEGYTVTTARNGLDALHTLAETDFDMVLMDVRMPGMDGLTAATFLRQCEQGGQHRPPGHADLARCLSARRAGSRIPVVGITGHIHDGDIAAQAGMDHLITKPFDLDELFLLIQRLCGERRTVPLPES